MTEYIQVDRDQLRVGMRFDYRTDTEAFDGIERRLTNLDPLTYHWGASTVVLTDGELEDRTFWVHPDDLHVDEVKHDDAELRAAYERGVNVGRVQGRQDAQSRGTYMDGYEFGRKELKTEQDARDARLAAVTLAAQAQRGDGDLIYLAQQIERYVNGNDEQEAKVNAPELPTVIETAEQTLLDWPAGTLVKDSTGDTWVRAFNSNLPDEYNDGWTWTPNGERRGNMYITLGDYLPATVTRLGAE